MAALATMPRISDKAGPVAVEAGVSLHRQLFLVLHDEIARGALSPGDPLPSEQALCDQFGVSRITVRRALADLTDQGYIERRQGVGSFVCQRCPTEAPAVRVSFLDGLRQAQFETKADVVEHDVRIPPRAVATVLGISDDTLHVLRVRRERRTREPLMVTEAWLPVDLTDALPERALRCEPLYELLSGAGVSVDRMQHEISAEIAGPRNAHLLDVPIGSALLRVNRLAFVAGLPHHYMSILLSPNRSRILLSQSAADLEAGDGFTVAHDVRRELRPDR